MYICTYLGTSFVNICTSILDLQASITHSVAVLRFVWQPSVSLVSLRGKEELPFIVPLARWEDIVLEIHGIVIDGEFSVAVGEYFSQNSKGDLGRTYISGNVFINSGLGSVTNWLCKVEW